VSFADGVLKVYVCAAPVDGEANAAVVALVAKSLGVAKSSVAIVRGESSRDKLLRVDLPAAELAARLAKL
jgi:uncharacterized protein YggU (UPF0235/DUF167 family)